VQGGAGLVKSAGDAYGLVARNPANDTVGASAKPLFAA